MKRKEILEILSRHTVEVEFIKANGELRKMLGTRKNETLQKELGPPVAYTNYKEQIDEANDNVTLFDLEKKGFRSFKVSRLKDLKIVE